MLVGASTTPDEGRTKSKAAIFFLGEVGEVALDAGDVPGGTYLPTTREVGVSSFTALSDQVIGSGGFWEVGLKNEETASSILQLGSKFHQHYLGSDLLVIVDWTFRLTGGGEIASSSLSPFLRFGSRLDDDMAAN